MDENEYSSRDELDREADLVEELSSDEDSRRKRVAAAARQQQQQERKQRTASEDSDEEDDASPQRPAAHSKEALRAGSKALVNGATRGGSRLPSMGRHQFVARQRAMTVSDHDDDEGSIDLEMYSDLELEDADDIDAPEMDEDEEGQDEEEDEEITYQLRGAILGICSALGGYEEVQQEDGSWKEVYVPGDDCIGCLRDLRKLWSRDDEDTSRRIARIYAEVNLLKNDLLPILLATAGKGERGNKIALACTDMITTLTWPIDIENEIRVSREKDEDMSYITYLTFLVKAQVGYKSSMLQVVDARARGPDNRDVLTTIVREVLLPPLSKPRPMRSERDNGTISMCMHLFRNLLAIRDPPAPPSATPESIANSQLQSKLLLAMQESHVLEILLMLCSSAEDRNMEAWNAVAMECVYHVYVGTKPQIMAASGIEEIPTSAQKTRTGGDAEGGGAPEEEERHQQSEQKVKAQAKSNALQHALATSLLAEAKVKRKQQMQSGSARHTRFGTTVSYVDSNGQRRVARNMDAIRKGVGELEAEVMTKEKRRKTRRRKMVRESGGVDDKPAWTTAAAVTVKAWAERFLQKGFEPLTRAMWKAIRSEDAKMGDLDQARIRMMHLGAWFLEFFLARRSIHAQAIKRAAASRESAEKESGEGDEAAVNDTDKVWPFSLVFEWTKPWALRMVLIRTDAAIDTKSWLEFNSTVDLWTILFRLMEELSRSDNSDDQAVGEAAQEKVFYDSTSLDYCRVVMGSYKAQSFATLKSIVDFTYHMPKMLERFCSNKEHIYIRTKKRMRKNQEGDEDDAAFAEADQDRTAKESAAETYKERSFQFQNFQRKLCTKPVALACIRYLERWQEFLECDAQLARLVGVMHRLAIKAGSPQLFFSKEIRSVLVDLAKPSALAKIEAVAPKASKDLKKLLSYVLKKFSKLPAEEKAAYDKGKRPPRPPKAQDPNRELMVKPGHSVEEQIGIAMSILIEMNKVSAIIWAKDGLETACAQRREIILHTDGDIDPMARRSPPSPSHASSQRSDGDDPFKEDMNEARKDNVAEGVPSAEAQKRFEALELRYDGDEELRNDASSLPELKMLLRLIGLQEENDPEDERKPWSWSVPVDLWPMHLESDIKTMDKYLTNPIVPEEGTLRDLIKKVPKPRGPRRPEEWEEADADIDAFLARENNSDRNESSASESDASATAIEKKQKRLEKLRKKANIPKPSRAKPKKQAKPTWNHNDFIEDSDEELAQIEAAMAREGDGEMSVGRRQHERPSSSTQGSSGSEDRVVRSSPPTSSPPAAKVSRLAAGKKRQPAKHARSSSDEDASDAGSRRRKSNKLFLGDSDEDMSDASPRKARRSPSPAGSDDSDIVPIFEMPIKRNKPDSSGQGTRSQTRSPIKLGRSLFLGSSQDHGDHSPEKLSNGRESGRQGRSPVKGGASLFGDREESPPPVVAAARTTPVIFGSPTSAPKQSKASEDWEERLRRQLLEEEEDENLFKDGKGDVAAPIAAAESPSPAKKTYARVRQPSADPLLSPSHPASERGTVSPAAGRKRAFSFGSDVGGDKEQEEEDYSSGKLYSEDLPSTAFVPLQLPSREPTESPVKRPRKRKPVAPRPKMVDSGGEEDELEG